MLTIENLYVKSEDNEILKGLNLKVNKGEIHAIMGPNGSGKSTLSKVVAGHPEYQVTGGSIELETNFKMKNLLDMEPFERARSGIFLAFQYPAELPGVSNFSFLHSIFNANCKAIGAPQMDAMDFKDFLEDKMKLLDMDESFLSRSVNEDFSGGEKKRNEILQMAILNPKIAFLDETDSGLDVDSLKIVSAGVNKLKNSENAVVLITHYQRILKYIKPDFVHILCDGKIVKTGGSELAEEIERTGYEKFV